jgi:phosphatidylserine/phosphatidylglycerophosphate/cardiolipin synthase-like enzyme
MKCSAVAAALVATLVVTGCRPDESSSEGPDGGMGDIDASADGVGCTPLTPRATDVEAFVAPSGFQNRMTALIDSATTTLDIQMYLFTVKSIADKIVAAKQRGVTVRVLLDPDHEGNSNVTPVLTAGGVNWKNAPSLYTFSHAKYLIVDKKQVVIMSGNWNVDAFINERNYGIVDRDPEDIADVQALFEQDWAIASGMTVSPPDMTCTRLIISPTNAKVRLLEHIKSAKSTLDLEVMYISETSVRSEVVAAKNRGVTVRVLINDATDDAVPVLKAAGIEVKTPGPFYLHAKLITADGVAFVGSENMSYTSLQKNREVGALVFEPAAYQVIQNQFNTDWNASTVVP